MRLEATITVSATCEECGHEQEIIEYDEVSTYAAMDKHALDRCEACTTDETREASNGE